MSFETVPASQRPVAFIPEAIAANGLEALAPHCECVAPWQHGEKPDPHLLSQADAVIVRLFKITRESLGHCDRLKVIAKHGAGVDNIDVAAATARRIPVVYTPAANANAVAEHTLTLMLALARQVYPASAALRAGRFSERNHFEGVELAGKTLGVLGLGRIGARVAEMAHRGFGMEVRGFDPLLAKSGQPSVTPLEDSVEALLAQSDFLTLHVPLTPATRHLINAERLRVIKPGCRIINTSRGAVIDETALVMALEQGQLGGAALDVFENEPLPADHPLCRVPNILLTPHIASSTQESLARMAGDAAQGVLDVLQGRRPQWIVNPETLG